MKRSKKSGAEARRIKIYTLFNQANTVQTKKLDELRQLQTVFVTEAGKMNTEAWKKYSEQIIDFF